MEMEKILYDLYTDPNLTEIERNNKLFSEFYPLFLNKKTGSFFTSPDIAKSVTYRCIGESIKTSSLKVLDPACGVGEFLISAANRILHGIMVEKNYPPEEETELRCEIISKCLIGFDIDEQIVNLCKFRLLLWSICPNLREKRCSFSEIKRKQKKFKCNILHRDFFHIYQDQQKFDIILCNPPYNAAMSERQEIEFQKKFPTIIRNSAAYFYLLCESLLDIEGKMGFILPKSLAYSKRWRSLKNQILLRLDFIQDISKAFQKVKLEEIILISSRVSNLHCYTTQINTHNPIQVPKSTSFTRESLILSLSPGEYELYKQLFSLSHRLEDFIAANRGLNIQKLAEKNEKGLVDPIYCIGGKEVKSFYHLPIGRIIKSPNENIDLESSKFVSILGQLANAHVKYPQPHYNLAFTYTPHSLKWISFDTVINISLKKHEISHHSYFSDYLLCFLNSDVFSWYLYKIVYAGAIRSTRLDAEYLNKVPFLPIQENKHNLFEIFHFLVSSLTLLSQYFFLEKKTDSKIPEMLKKTKLLMNSLIFILYLSDSHTETWLNSLDMKNKPLKSCANLKDIENNFTLLWNPTYTEILKQLKKNKLWKIVIIEEI